jgi:polysaccharide pyruvyl transferase WcaK-like protein
VKAIRACQLNTGLGAGNIGDDLMARAFWQQAPSELTLDVTTFPGFARLREPYPQEHRYHRVDWDGNECATLPRMPGLLVGDTPVTTAEGVHWPMQFLARRLQHYHSVGQPVDAVGVGVDCSIDDQGKRLFHDYFLPIRSWTVRSPSCKRALVALGVSDSRVVVGADFAWLYAPVLDLRAWASAFWRELTVEPEAPLLVVNVVNLGWRDRTDLKRNLAAALDWICEHLAMQIAFFCNETRDGELFDHAAALEVLAFMTKPAVIVPNEYYSPAEAIALLECATVTFGQRYHFMIESVLAGCVPVGSLRGDKMRDLVAELPIPTIGPVESLEKEAVAIAVQETVTQRDEILNRLTQARSRLAVRAQENVCFLRELPPYAAIW